MSNRPSYQEYEKKKVSVGKIVALVAGVLIFSFAVMTGVTVHHIATEGVGTESDGALWDLDREEI